MEEIINGKRASEIWINLLTPERAAELERAYQSRLRETRRRIDAKFANRRSASPELRSRVQRTAPQPRTSVRVTDNDFQLEQHRRRVIYMLALGD
jgi:hypothetical protein